MDTAVKQRAKPLQQFAKERTISMPTVYRKIACGELIAHKIGSRTFVLAEHEVAFDAALHQLPAHKAVIA